MHRDTLDTAFTIILAPENNFWKPVLGWWSPLVQLACISGLQKKGSSWIPDKAIWTIFSEFKVLRAKTPWPEI